MIILEGDLHKCGRNLRGREMDLKTTLWAGKTTQQTEAPVAEPNDLS